MSLTKRLQRCKKVLAAGMAAAMAVQMLPAMSVSAAAKQTFTEEQIKNNDYVLYTVNCGTSNPEVVPAGAKMGVYQSNLEQECGEDSGTGLTWGYRPDDENTKRATGTLEGGTGLLANFVYLSDQGTTFVADKTGIKYDFELPMRDNNLYSVTVGSRMKWDKRSFDVDIEGKKVERQKELPYDQEVALTYEVEVTDGELNVMVHNPDAGDNRGADPILSYIIVKAVPETPVRKLTKAVETYQGKYDAAVKSQLYTDASKKAFTDAVAAAQTLIAAATEDDNAADQAVKAIEDAYSGLVKENGPTYTSFTGTNGAQMYTTDGSKIQAHGGQIQKINDTWYWIGEDRTNGYRPMPGVHLYSSKDLYNWTYEGVVLRTMENEEQFDTDEYFKILYGDLTAEQKKDIYVDLWAEGCVMERPKMLYNEETGKYVIWFHADGTSPYEEAGDSNYAKAKAGIAVADNPAGPYKLLGSYMLAGASEEKLAEYKPDFDSSKPHGFDLEGGHVRDMNLFQDDDGTAYVMYSSEGNAVMYIARLNDSYTGLAKDAGQMVLGEDFCISSTDSREGPAMFKYQDKYYLITSGCTGWAPNQAAYAVADSPLGPWKRMGDPCVGDNNHKTFDTQSTCVIPVDAAKGQFIYMGDRWFWVSDEWNKNPYPDRTDLSDSRYVWLPIEFGADSTIMIKDYQDWTLSDLENKGSIEIKTKLPEYADSIGSLEAALPETVDVGIGGTDYKDQAVAWSIAENQRALGDYAIGNITVTGRLTEIGREFTTMVFCAPDSLQYLADCNVSEDNAKTYNAAKKYVGSVRNEVPDQQYSEGKDWGYTSTPGASKGSSSEDMGSHGDGDLYDSGWWASDSGEITYRFALDPGSYVVSTGHQEWWSSTRGIQVKGVSVDADGRETEIGSTTFTLSGEQDMQKQTKIKVPKGSDHVLVKVSKASGSAPVLSWIGISETKPSADGNLVENGSFENGSSGWAIGSEASIEEGANGSIPDGTHYLRDHGIDHGTWKGDGSSQRNIFVSPDTEYVLTGKAKIDSNSSPYYVGVKVDGKQIYSVFLPGSEFTEENTDEAFTYEVKPNATDWTDFEIRFSTSGATDAVEVYTWIDSNYGYLDQVVLKEATVTGGGDTYYVDAANGDDSRDGTSPETAWKTLSKASSLRNLTAGGKILLKAGCEWNDEQLSVRNAKGTEADPVVIGSYGEGEKPLINGNGANWKADTKEKLAAVHIYNCENIVVEDLAVTNWDTSAGALVAGESDAQRPQSRKLLSGMVVENRDGGTLSNVTIRNNKIYNVNGLMKGGAEKAAGGLIVVVTGGGENHTGKVESRYDGLTISGNEVSNVCHEAIYMESVWAARKLVGGSYSDTSYQNAGNSRWIGSSNVKIEHNYVHDAAGDGIVPINTTDALVQYNLICNSADSRWDYRENENHAALWAWNADNVTFRYNEACHTSIHSKGTHVGNDSMAFDFDYGVQNCLYEYNYSHDNLGGFLMLCPGPGASVNNIARYNVSVNDGLYDGAPIIRMGSGKYGSIGVQIYNNTMYWTDSGYTPSLMPASAWEGDVIEGVEVFNNIFYGPAKADSVTTTGVTYHHNALFGGAQDVYKASANDENIVEADPGFADVKQGTGYTEGTWADGKTTLGTVEGFHIADGSPCVNKGAGYPDAPAYSTDVLASELVPNEAAKPQRDYYHNPIQDGTVDIGAHEVTAAIVVAKDKLQAAYDLAAGYKADGYTTDSYQTLQAAMAEAKKVLDKTDATQEEVETQTELLEAAIQGLKLEVIINKEALEKLCEEARAIAKDGYTEESYAALQTAITDAETVLENGKTQSEIDDAVTALQKAIDGLVKEKTVTGITVSKNPTKAEYIQGEELAATGLEIEVTYSDDTKEKLTEGFEVSGYDKDKTGEQTVTVTYGGHTAEFKVTVKEKEPEPEKTVTGIMVSKNPAKVEYTQGEELATTGLEIEVTYSDDTKEKLTEGFEVSGYNKDQTGEQTVTVTYKGHTAEFKVTVKEKEPEPEPTVTAIAVNQIPTKTEYIQGETFDTEGLELEVTYSDGSVKYVSSGYAVSGYDPAASGEQTITVEYEGCTAAFQITVKEAVPIQNEEQQVTVAIPEGSGLDAGSTTLKVEKPDTADETVSQTFAEIEQHIREELQITDVNVTAENTTVLDIVLVNENGEQVQPDSDVLVTIPKPQGYSDRLKLYHKHEGESPHEVVFQLRDSRELVFRANRFSHFIIVDLDRSANLPEVDRSSLEAALAEAGALNPADYEETAWNKFETAVRTAQGVYDDPDAGQEEVNAQADGLRAAIEELKKHPAQGEVPVTPADKTRLEELIRQAQSLKKEDYTTDSWEALQKALEEGNAVNADVNTAQEQVNAAAAALEDAIKGLKSAAVPVTPADKTRLGELIRQAQGLKKEDYTADSWETLQKALEEGNAVNADADAAQEQVDAAAAALESAIGGLAKNPNPGTGDDQKNPNPGSAQNPGSGQTSGGNQGAGNTVSPRTADETPVVTLLSIALIALAVIAGCIYTKNMRRKRIER